MNHNLNPKPKPKPIPHLTLTLSLTLTLTRTRVRTQTLNLTLTLILTLNLNLTLTITFALTLSALRAGVMVQIVRALGANFAFCRERIAVCGRDEFLAEIALYDCRQYNNITHTRGGGNRERECEFGY